MCQEHVHTCMYAWKPKGVHWIPGNWITGGCQPPEVGVGNSIQVLWNSRECS